MRKKGKITGSDPRGDSYSYGYNGFIFAPVPGLGTTTL